ncbi:hypothetical protein L209DRAFT_749425 [Thermothelomyces heterothallicus CBS 203.75]
MVTRLRAPLHSTPPFLARVAASCPPCCWSYAGCRQLVPCRTDPPPSGNCATPGGAWLSAASSASPR